MDQPKKVITVVDNEYYFAKCYPEQGLIQHRWKKHATGDAFRNNVSSAAGAFVRYKCYRWLGDDREFNGVFSPEDWKWGSENFVGRCADAGWKYFALVLPEATMARLSIKAVSAGFVSRGINTKVFTDFAEAQKWIFSQSL